MKKKHTLILIDGHALAFREYYALERTNMQTSDGQPTWAVYGFFKAIFDLMKNASLRPDSIAVTFDVSHHTFRTEKYDNYKSNRSEMPDTMKSQMQLIYDGLTAFDIPIYTKEGYEADDVIGTISKLACERGYEVLILTGDQDAFQLVDSEGCVKVILPSFQGQKEYGWYAIYDKLGVYPNQVIDYKALRGDTSDCIPGVKGIGEKTACMLLNSYHSLDSIYEHIDEIHSKSVKEKLIMGKEDAYMSQYLATIVRDLDINFDFEQARVKLPQVDKVTKFLKDMQFHSFIKNVGGILNSFSQHNPLSDNFFDSEVQKQEDASQLGLFAKMVESEINKDNLKYSKEIVTDSEDFELLIKNLTNKEVISFELIAEYENAVDFDLVGIAFAYDKSLKYNGELEVGNAENIETFYIPVGHKRAEKQLPADFVLDKLKSVFEDDSIKKITYNYKVQINLLRKFGIGLNGCVFDCMLSSYVKNPSRKHDLDIQSFENLDHAITSLASYSTNSRKSLNLKDLSLTDVMDWAVDRVSVIIKLADYWIKNLEDGEYKFFKEIEMPLSRVLADMEFVGVSVDKDYLGNLTEQMNEIVKDNERKIYEVAGKSFNLNSPKQIAEVLFEDLALPNKKLKGKNANSTSAEVLESLAKEFDIARYILEYRKYSKLISTYTIALPSLINKSDERIHTTYNQATTATGRLSSSNPNLQNIPTRTEEGRKIRNAFVPKDRENYSIISADYSQIELRLLAHISNDENLIKAFCDGVDIHTLTAAKVFDVNVQDVTKVMRYRAKTVNFGIIYGQTKYGLAQALNITPKEAEDFIEKYFASYPKIQEYISKTIELAEKNGFVQTLYGRRRYLASELASSNRQIREFAKRAAINQPIQGTSADLIKIAMNEFYKKLKENNLESKLIMQVHDELVVEVPDSEIEIVKTLLKESMELNNPFSVPLLVDISVGKSWRE